MNVDKVMKTLAPFNREKTVIFRLPGGEIYRVHGDRCGVNTQGEPIFHLEKIEDRMNHEIRRQMLHDSGGYRPIVLPDSELEGTSEALAAANREEMYQAGIPGKVAKPVEIETLPGDELLGGEEQIHSLEIHEQIGITPAHFADDETLKAYQELQSTPNETPNPFFMAECDHPNIQCSRDGEFNKEECPDCGYTREWEDD